MEFARFVFGLLVEGVAWVLWRTARVLVRGRAREDEARS
jgi:hypothetical protein